MEYLNDDIEKFLKKVCVPHDEKDTHKTLQENCHQAYKDACDHYEEMAVHVYGTQPRSLLEKIRPREDPEIREYRLASYRPITKSTCKKAINVINKIFNPKFSSIRFEDNAKAQLLKRYSLEDYPRFNSVVNYLSDYALKKGFADPNAIFLVQPYKLPYSTTERIMPYVSCYLSKNIHYIDENYALLFEKYERDEKAQRWYYTFADKVGVYNLLIEKTTSQDANIIEIGRYMHNRGKLPFWFLGGEYSEKYEGLFESFIYPAVPFWDEVIMDHSDLRGSIRMHMFPQKWEVADECDYIEDGKYGCEGGIISPDKGKPHVCPSCQGAGRKSVKSPYQTYWVPKDRFNNPDGTSTGFSAPFGYVEPGTETTKLLKEERDLGLRNGLSALNMDVLNNMGTNQSGISKDIDRRTELQEFLQKIADQYFCVHLPNIFDWFAWYMFGVEESNNEASVREILPEISKPCEFDVYTTGELTAQLQQAKTAKVNPSYLAVKQAEVQNKEFQTHPELLKPLNLELKLDPLAEQTREDIGMMLMNQTVTKQTAIIHDNIRAFVKRALEEDDSFADKEYSEQMEILKSFAEEIIEENKVQLDMTLLEDPIEKEAPIPVE
jgi:hypothetical protein